MTQKQVKDMLKPLEKVPKTILGWLSSQGSEVTQIKDDGDWIDLWVTVERASTMLDTTFYNFYREVNDFIAIRTLQYSMPPQLNIKMIQLTTSFGNLCPQINRVDAGNIVAEPDHPSWCSGIMPAFCNTTVTLACLRWLYGLGNFTARLEGGTKLGILGYLTQYA